MQSQVSANDKAKTDETTENQKTYEKRQIARMSEQQTDEVEETQATEDVYVRREDERQRDGRDARDTWEHHKKEKLYHDDEQQGSSDNTDDISGADAPKDETGPDEDQSGGLHIDVSI